jgi:hypothetical protein
LIIIPPSPYPKKEQDIFSQTEPELESHQIAASYPWVIKHRFPELLPSFKQLPDTRKPQGKEYGIEAVMFGGLSLFLFKEGSRNQLNNHRKDGHFCEHYHQLFGMKLPHMDTVNDVLCDLANEKLEQIKMDSMSGLFEQKWLRDYRLLGKHYLVAVDATGTQSFDERHCPHCLTKTFKKGGKEKTIYFHYVLEAKLITSDGHAFSFASEWIENPDGEFDKQDCERKAFIRLAKKLKKQYPRLPICILADGLYPYENAFKICEENQWKFIFVLQDSLLKTVQEELTLTRRKDPATECYTMNKGWRIKEEYRYQTDIEYHKKYTLNWIQCMETRNKIKKKKTKTPLPKPQNSCFEYLTNIEPNNENVRAISHSGRLRWKIENEGFNTQKCGDYELEHLFNRTSYNGLKNYYTLLQIAHTINQLIEKGKFITEIKKIRPKETLHNLWNKLKHYMIFCMPDIRKNENQIITDTS